MRKRNEIDEPTAESQRLFYNERWEAADTKLNHLQVARLAAVLEGFSMILQDAYGQSLEICDLGCGARWLANEASKFGRVTAIDMSPKGIELARTRWPGVTFLCGEAVGVRRKTPFDIVLSSEVIEHVSDQGGYVQTISAIWKPGGHMILTCPDFRVKRAMEKTWIIGTRTGELPR